MLKEVMASSYQLRVIQMVVKHQGGREHDFKEQYWRLRVKKGGLSDSTPRYNSAAASAPVLTSAPVASAPVLASAPVPSAPVLASAPEA